MAPLTNYMAFVAQSRKNMAEVKKYIEVGMETTLRLATDLFGKHETGTLDVDKQKVVELKDTMLDYIRMERELNDFLSALDLTTEHAKTLDSNTDLVNLECILDQKLAELQQNYNDDELQKHDKFVGLLEKLTGAKQGEEASGSTEDVVVVDDDEDVADEDVVSVNTKCPITAKDMVHVDPVPNEPEGGDT